MFKIYNLRRAIISTLLGFILIQTSGFAQKKTEPDSTLKVVPIRETIVSANRSSQSRTAVAQQVTVLRKAVIQQANAQNSADLLTMNAGIFVQKSQQGGGSPVLRGFEANRVLLVVDGIRMNNAIYRGGHLQNIITLDNAALERVEILFGPASTVYGSDALGGAVCFYTKNPELAKTAELRHSGSAFARYGTVNKEKTGHVDFNVAGQKLGSFTSLTFSDFGDLRMGKNTGNRAAFGERLYYVERIAGRDSLVANADPLVQKFSGYRQYDLLQKLLWRPKERSSHTLNVQFSNSSDVPRYDRLTDPLQGGGGGLRNAEWYYGPQQRLLGAYHFETEPSGWFDRLGASLSVQRIGESRHQRRLGSPQLQHRTERVQVYGLESEAQKNWTYHSIRVGLDAQYNDVQSTALEENIESGAKAALDTRYPDGGSSLYNLAVFSTHNWQTPKLTRWSFSEGLRLGFTGLKAQFRDRSFFQFPFETVRQNTPVWSGSLGAVWRPAERWRFAVNASSGFRVPNIDDLGKVFESQLGAVIVPNPDIKPEQSYNFDLNLTRQLAGRFHWENVIWLTALNNAIVIDFFQFNGADSIDFNGVRSQVLANQNKNRARLWGFTSNLEADISDRWAAYGSIAFTHGRVVQEGAEQPLDHIPPIHGRAGIRYHDSRLNTEVFVLYNGKKPIDQYAPTGEDNERYAPPGGMPGWFTLNLRAGYRIQQQLTVQAGVDNLLDRQYRNFASGINAPGRNVWLTLRLNW